MVNSLSLVSSSRRIGPRGTVARIVVGVAMIFGASLIGVSASAGLLGLSVAPVLVLLVVAARGHRRSPIRLTGPDGHCLNCGVGIAAFVFFPVAALLFYGASMLLAAARGYAGCELFAVSNALLGRDDEIACAVFAPVDRIDIEATRGQPGGKR